MKIDLRIKELIPMRQKHSFGPRNWRRRERVKLSEMTTEAFMAEIDNYSIKFLRLKGSDQD
jgi:hypothetical protein